MNPWEAVSWIGAFCVAVVMLVVTAQIVRNTIKPNRAGTKPIIRKR